MKIRFSQVFFLLSQPKLSVHFKILFPLMFFKKAIVILCSMYFFGRNTPTYLPKFFFLLEKNEGNSGKITVMFRTFSPE